MKLWYLSQTVVVMSGAVRTMNVRADTSHDARRMASENCGSEGPNVWTNYSQSGCQCTSAYAVGPAGVVTRDVQS